MINYFENLHAAINYLPESKTIEVKWKLRDADSSSYRVIMSKGIVVTKMYDVEVWLSDMAEVKALPDEDKKWLMEILLPNLPLDITKVAFVLNATNYSVEQAEQFIHSALESGMNAHYFYTSADALAWINS